MSVRRFYIQYRLSCFWKQVVSPNRLLYHRATIESARRLAHRYFSKDLEFARLVYTVQSCHVVQSVHKVLFGDLEFHEHNSATCTLC